MSATSLAAMLPRTAARPGSITSRRAPFTAATQSPPMKLRWSRAVKSSAEVWVAVWSWVMMSSLSMGPGSETQHGTDDLTCCHEPERVIHVLDRHAACDHGFKIELAGLGQGHEPGDVPAHLGRPVTTAEQPLLSVQREQVEGHPLSGRPGADENNSAA